MTLRLLLSVVAGLTALGLAGCADTAPSEHGFKPFVTLMRNDDETLTKAEQKAAITELQQDKSKQEQAAKEGAAAPANTAQ